MGSSSEYGKNNSPLKENLKCRPNSIYGKSKLLATNYLMEQHKFYKFPAVILRLFQAYGPNQKTNRLLPFVIEGCLNNISFDCSTGKQKRDFIYIDDLIKIIFVCLKNKRAIGEIFNVGVSNPIRIKDIIYLYRIEISIFLIA